MNEFQSIMHLMNNGIQNNSTLKDSIPAIVKFTLRFGKAQEALAWVPSEASLQTKKGHEGLDEIVSICEKAVKTNLEQSKVR